MKRKKSILLILIILTSFLFISSISLAKYVSNKVWNQYLKSQGFYFESETLSTSGKTTVNTLWNGSKVDLSVQNNNQSQVTNTDIEYEMTCTIEGDAKDSLKCFSNGKEKYTGVLSSVASCVNNSNIDTSELTKTECELNGYTWQYMTTKNDLYFEVVKTDESYTLSDVTVNVNITSKTPYKKTLKGTYILKYNDIKDGEITSTYKNFTDYNRLTITNSYSTDKCINISYDGTTKTLDIDSSLVKGSNQNGNINEIELIIKEKTSESFIVYDSEDEITNNFVITVTDGCKDS